jgi:predicted RNA-binding Zn-ribbon protein involved in translation (DUF1610 family)
MTWLCCIGSVVFLVALAGKVVVGVFNAAQMACPGCGNAIAVNARRCPHCGYQR